MSAKPNIVYPTPKQIAQGLGVCTTTARDWIKAGMPNSTIAAAEEWMRANKPHVGKKTTPVSEEIKLPIVALPETEDPYEVVKRLRFAERTIASHITGWIEIALPEAIKERNKAKGKALVEAERKVNIINHKIEHLRREQRQAVSALLDAEGDVVKLERARGKLITIDEAKDLISKSLVPVCIALRKLPESATSEEERKRFAAIAEALLAVLRDSASGSIKEDGTAI